MAATPEWYLEHNIHAIPLTSAHAVSIPGAVDAWETILRDHGKFGFDTLLQPALKAAVAGDVIHQPELAQTLRAIARDGRDAFYSGAIAADMVETLRGIGGLHTLEDFAAHSTETTIPIGTVYKGHDVWQCPPNGPGITMLVMLNILARFDLTKFPAMSVERFHLE